MEASYSSMDEALEILSAYGPDLQNGMTSHAPMAAEALCAMGRPEAVIPWVETHRKGMLPRAEPGARIDRAGWRAALGRMDRAPDWGAFFAEELKEASWPDVIDRWVGRLAPGMCAAATHGVIRVGRAVAHGDEHAIKFAEVCLGRHALRPSSAYLAAVSNAPEVLPGARWGRRERAGRKPPS
jgi:hypothetical protein